MTRSKLMTLMTISQRRTAALTRAVTELMPLGQPVTVRNPDGSVHRGRVIGPCNETSTVVMVHVDGRDCRYPLDKVLEWNPDLDHAPQLEAAR